MVVAARESVLLDRWRWLTSPSLLTTQATRPSPANVARRPGCVPIGATLPVRRVFLALLREPRLITLRSVRFVTGRLPSAGGRNAGGHHHQSFGMEDLAELQAPHPSSARL